MQTAAADLASHNPDPNPNPNPNPNPHQVHWRWDAEKPDPEHAQRGLNCRVWVGSAEAGLQLNLQGSEQAAQALPSYHPCRAASRRGKRYLVITPARQRAGGASPPSSLAAASTTYGHDLWHLRLQPPSPTVAASVTHGCSLHHLRLQPPSPTVAASVTYGCSLRHLRLQAEQAASSSCGNDENGVLQCDRLSDAQAWHVHGIGIVHARCMHAPTARGAAHRYVVITPRSSTSRWAAASGPTVTAAAPRCSKSARSRRAAVAVG
eukprot:scaffold48929_cov42-Phaeocystis_antarctica.AAC.1